MNMRDKIRPKSIRVAILTALEDGSITTIDDLQTRMDEDRKKIAANVYPAAVEGLIKRLRDDVTGSAAYQITDKGRDLLAKYASGKEIPPADILFPAAQVAAAIEAAPKPVFSSRMKTDFPSIPEKSATSAAELEQALASKNAELERLAGELREAEAALVLARLARPMPEPSGFVLQRPKKPLVRFTQSNSAETRAMSFAKSGQRAQVFALVLVGTAVPGAEWRKA